MIDAELDTGNIPSFKKYMLMSLSNLSGLLLWVITTFCLIGALLWVQWKSKESSLLEKATSAYESVYEKIQINEAVLEGFASLLRLVGDNDLEQVRRFTKEMRIAYPHIYMLEAQTAVSDREKFENTRRANGYPEYTIKRFSYEDTRGWHDVKPRSVYYPIHFIDPMGTNADQVLGLDILSVTFLHDALIKAIQSGEAVASKPFTLVEGGNAYVLFKTLKPKLDFNPNDMDVEENTVVSLLIKTNELLKYASQNASDSDIKLFYKHTDGEDVTESYQAIPTHEYLFSLGKTTFRRTLDDFGQPFIIEIRSMNGVTKTEMGVILIMLIMSGFGSWLYYKNTYQRYLSDLSRDRALKALQEERESLEIKVANRTQELVSVNESLNKRIDENKELTQKLITMQEDEYKNIARELHDEFGQKITAITINAKLLLDKLSKDNQVMEYLDDIQKTANRLYDSMKSMIGRLRPEALDTFGLKAVIEQCIQSFKLESHGIKLVLSLSEDIDSIKNEYAITIYRATQELINNAIKHGNPNYIEIVISSSSSLLILQVKDDGVGMPVKDQKLGFGLLGLKERIAAFNGKLIIGGSQNEQSGCIVTVELPVRDRK